MGEGWWSWGLGGLGGPWGSRWPRAGGPGVLGVSVALGGLGGRGLVVPNWGLMGSTAEGGMNEKCMSTIVHDIINVQNRLK